jgi:hypothetical protein
VFVLTPMVNENRFAKAYNLRSTPAKAKAKAKAKRLRI